MPLVISGATASGKSAVALALAGMTGGEVVCADAFQLYAGLPILTAQPVATELEAVPHHLYGGTPLTAGMDAARYGSMAETVIAGIEARGRLAIVTGGSGLYLKAVTHGLSPLPTGDARLRAELDALPPGEAVARLLTLDPAAAASVNLRNPRYVQRALEIVSLTGQPLAAVKSSFATGPRPGMRGIFLHRDRNELHDRINRRTLQMFAGGVLEEVRAIDFAALSATAEKTLGLREIRECLAGLMSPDEAIAAIQQVTRRYAKRQGTWFRRETWMRTIDATGRRAEEVAEAILAGDDSA